MSTQLPKEAIELIEGRNLAFLATLMKDGSPQVTPVWIDHDGDTILINTVVGRTKQKNTVRDPRIALAVIDSRNPYKMLAIRGRVVEQTTEGAEEHIDKLAKKYLGEDKYRWRKPGERRLLLKIKPERVIVKQW